jgi:hypothetical protein
MAGKLLRSCRGSPLRQIDRAGAGHRADRPEPRRDERGIGQAADPHGDVEPLLDQIDDAVDQQHARREPGIRRKKLDHHRQHMQPAEHHGSGHGKLALRLGMLAGEAQIRGIELILAIAEGGSLSAAGWRLGMPLKKSPRPGGGLPISASSSSRPPIPRGQHIDLR